MGRSNSRSSSRSRSRSRSPSNHDDHRRHRSAFAKQQQEEEEGSRPERSPIRAPNSDDGQEPGENNKGSALYVTCLSKMVKDRDFEDLFAKYGKIQNSRILKDPHTQESRCFGFVTFEEPAAAQAAMEALNGYELEGRNLVIQMAKRDRARTPTPGKYIGPPKPRLPPPRRDNYYSRPPPPRRDTYYDQPRRDTYAPQRSGRDDFNDRRVYRDNYDRRDRDTYQPRYDNNNYNNNMRRDDGRRDRDVVDSYEPRYDDRRNDRRRSPPPPRYDDRRRDDRRIGGVDRYEPRRNGVDTYRP